MSGQPYALQSLLDFFIFKHWHVVPITFLPLYMERVWGGRELVSIYVHTLTTLKK